jgi:hypothetical protein
MISFKSSYQIKNDTIFKKQKPIGVIILLKKELMVQEL